MANPASASASVMAVRWPPADQPETISFAPAMPYRDSFMRNQRIAVRDQRRVESSRQWAFRQTGKKFLGITLPITAMDIDEERRVCLAATKNIDAVPRSAAIYQIEQRFARPEPFYCVQSNPPAYRRCSGQQQCCCTLHQAVFVSSPAKLSHPLRPYSSYGLKYGRRRHGFPPGYF